MESRVKALGHPVHPMLIVFPLGLLATSVAFEIVYLITDNGKWSDIAYWMIAAGLIGGVLAAPFGLIDWLATPSGSRARSIGALHGAGNVVVLALFFISWLIQRGNTTDPGPIAIALMFVGLALAAVTGWLGGELVDRLGVGVDAGANVNAPSSLSDRPTRDAESGRARA